MSDFEKIVGQVSTVATQVAQVISVFKGQQPQVPGVPGAPVPVYQMPRDQVMISPTAMPQPQVPMLPQAPAPTAPQGGFMQALSGFFSKIASWFKSLFSRNQATAPAAGTLPVQAMPGVTPTQDARALLFQMFPAGRGMALGLWPVTVAKYPDRILLEAPGIMKAAVLNYQGQYFFYENDKQPVRIANVTATRGAAGETNFAIALENGKTVNAAILADGRTLRYQNHQITLQ